MKRSLHDAWWRVATAPPRSFADSLLAGALTGAAALYRAGVTVRNTAYDRGWLHQARLDCPVISVGNLAVGGTGKTTCAAYLAAKLRRQGKRVAILSRGYGGAHPQPYRLIWEDGGLQVNGRAAATTDGLPDEPQLLASQLAGVPVLVGARREQSGRMAREQWQVDAVVLDDALQYRRLARDCELILVSARMPLDGWPLLPRGPMREPLSSLRRADVILMTKADQSLDKLAALTERLKTFNPRALLATAIHEPEGIWEAMTSEPVPLDRLAGSRVALLSSIGDPEGFEETVRRLGATVVSHAAYPDHHRYDAREWQMIVKAASAAGALALVTTEKDLVRLRRLWTVKYPAHGRGILFKSHELRSNESPSRSPRQARGSTLPQRPLLARRAVEEMLRSNISMDYGRWTLPVWVLRIGMRLLSGEAELDARLAAVWAR